MSLDEAEGKLGQLNGNVKQRVGHVADDDRLRDECAGDEASGDVQEGFGNARRKIGETVEKLVDKIKR